MSNIEKTALSSLLDDLPVALNAALGAGIGGYGLSRYNKLISQGASELAEHNKNLEALTKLKASTKAPIKTRDILDYEDSLNRFNSGLTNKQPAETLRIRKYYDDLARYNDIQSRSIDSPNSIASSIAGTVGPVEGPIMSSLVPSLAAGAIGGQEAMLASLLAPRILKGTDLSTQMLSAAAAGHLGDIGFSHLSPGIQQSIGSSSGLLKNISDNLFSGYKNNPQTIANAIATDKGKIMSYLNPSRAFDEVSDIPRYLAAGMAGKYLNRRTAPTLTDAAVTSGTGLVSDIAKYVPGIDLYSTYSPKVIRQINRAKSYIDKKRYVKKEMREIEKLLADSNQKTSSYRNKRSKTAFLGKAWNNPWARTAIGGIGGGLIGAATADDGNRLSRGLSYAAGGMAAGGLARPLINKITGSQLGAAAANRYNQGKVTGNMSGSIKNFLMGKKTVATNSAAPTTTPGFDYLGNKLTSQAGTGGLGLDAATAGDVQTKLMNQSGDDVLRAMTSYGHNPLAYTAAGAAGGGLIGAATAEDGESALLKGLGYAAGGAALGRGLAPVSQYLQRAAMRGSAKTQAAMSGGRTSADEILKSRYQEKILSNNDFAGREVHKQLKTIGTADAARAGANLASARAGNVNFNANTGYLDDSGNFVVGIGSQPNAPAQIAENMAARVGAYNPQQFQSSINTAINSADQGAVNALMSRAAAGDDAAQRALNTMGAHMQDLAEVQKASYSNIASGISNTLNANVRGLKVDPSDLMNSPEFHQYVDIAESNPGGAKALLQNMIANLGAAKAGNVSPATLENALGAAVNTTVSGAKNLQSAVASKSQAITKHINESSKAALNYNISAGIDEANSALQTLRTSNPAMADEITSRLNAAVNELASTGQRGQADELIKLVNANLSSNKQQDALDILKKLSGKQNPYSVQQSSAFVGSLANSGKGEFNTAINTLKGRVDDSTYSMLQNLGSVSDRTRQAVLLGDVATLNSTPMAELERLAGAIDPSIAVKSFNSSVKAVKDPNVLATLSTKMGGVQPSPTVVSDATNLLNMSRQDPQQFANYMKTLSRSNSPENKFLHTLVSEQLTAHQNMLSKKILANPNLKKFRKGTDIAPDFANTSKVDAGNLLGDISSTTQAPVQSTLQAPVVSTQSAIAPTAAPTTANYGSAIKKGLIGAGVAGTGYGMYNMLSAPTDRAFNTTQP